MSVPSDFSMRLILDDYYQKNIGAKVAGEEDNVREIDISVEGLPFTKSHSQLFGESSLVPFEDRDTEKDWLEGSLVKTPQRIITPSQYGISHKKNLYVIFVKTPKGKSLYYNEALSLAIEKAFPNNLHIKSEVHNMTVTVLKTWQQPTTYLLDDLGRFQNRVFIQCETYYNNNETK